MRRALAVALVCAACDEVTGGDDIKLGRRSRDAGPAVIVVDRSERTATTAIPETEPNEPRGADSGQPLALPGAVRGTLGPGDRDAYRIVVPAPGTLRVALTGAEDADLVVEVRQPGGEPIVACDNGPAGTAEGFPNLFVQPGTLHVVVFEYVKPSAKPKRARRGKPPPPPPPRGGAPSQPYLLELRLAPPPAPGEEREPNDDTAFAGELPLGAVGRGQIGWRRDSDAWRVPLDGVRDDEGLSVDVEGIDDVALRVALVDGAGATLVERKGRPGASVSLRSVALPAGSALLFVTVGGDRPGNGEIYTVRVASAPLVVDEESEPNDTAASASPLADVPGASSGTRVGTLAAGDIDVFRLDPSDVPRELAVVVSPPAGVDVVLSASSSDGAVLAAPVDAGKKGAQERLPSVVVPAGQAALVRLEGKAGEGSERYRLRWTVSEVAAPVPGVDEP